MRSPFAKHAAQIIFFVPPCGLPSFNSTPDLVSITSRHPQRHSINAAGIDTFSRCRLRSDSGAVVLGTMDSFGTRALYARSLECRRVPLPQFV